MKNIISIRRLLTSLAFIALPALSLAESAAWVELLKTAGLEAFREPTAKWSAVSDAAMNPDNQKKIAIKRGSGMIFNGGKTKNLLTKIEHGDVELHIEFMVPRNSNSGVYFQGRYEIQVFDSWGVEDPKHSDCGGIYQRWVNKQGLDGHPPRTNASRKPGEWQTFDVIFKAPRFDADGKKIANAMFVKVVHNGVVVHENVELTGPTRSAAFKDEKALGPLMLQGDHGPVVYRNIRIKPLDASTR